MYDIDPLVGKYCGTVIPSTITTSSNFLYVRFISDESTHGSGFNASFNVVSSKH